MPTEEYFRGPPNNLEGYVAVSRSESSCSTYILFLRRMVSLKVDNLTYRTTVEDLQNVFTKFGKIGDVYIPRSARGSRGFAFVRYAVINS